MFVEEVELLIVKLSVAVLSHPAAFVVLYVYEPELVYVVPFQVYVSQAVAELVLVVELLIVIVVIAILAAITIVAYTGIQDGARQSSLQSSASQAAKKIAN